MNMPGGRAVLLIPDEYDVESYIRGFSTACTVHTGYSVASVNYEQPTPTDIALLRESSLSRLNFEQEKCGNWIVVYPCEDNCNLVHRGKVRVVNIVYDIPPEPTPTFRKPDKTRH